MAAVAARTASRPARASPACTQHSTAQSRSHGPRVDSQQAERGLLRDVTSTTPWTGRRGCRHPGAAGTAADAAAAPAGGARCARRGQDLRGRRPPRHRPHRHRRQGGPRQPGAARHRPRGPPHRLRAAPGARALPARRPHPGPALVPERPVRQLHVRAGRPGRPHPRRQAHRVPHRALPPPPLRRLPGRLPGRAHGGAHHGLAPHQGLHGAGAGGAVPAVQARRVGGRGRRRPAGPHVDAHRVREHAPRPGQAAVHVGRAVPGLRRAVPGRAAVALLPEAVPHGQRRAHQLPREVLGRQDHHPGGRVQHLPGAARAERIQPHAAQLDQRGLPGQDEAPHGHVLRAGRVQQADAAPAGRSAAQAHAAPLGGQVPQPAASGRAQALHVRRARQQRVGHAARAAGLGQHAAAVRHVRHPGGAAARRPGRHPDVHEELHHDGRRAPADHARVRALLPAAPVHPADGGRHPRQLGRGVPGRVRAGCAVIGGDRDLF